MSWHNLLKSTPRLVSFGLGATWNTLASLQNRTRWKFEDDIKCALCGKEEASVAHILGGCLSGRYTFRHNAILWVIAHELQVTINQVKKEVVNVCKDSIITFVKEGEQHKTSSRKYNKSGILHEAKDWVMKIDVDQQLRFPEAICISTQRPDIVIYSLKLRKVILIELTCPAEMNIEKMHSEKISRYEGLLKDCINAGCKVHRFAIEVGPRGYGACSLRSCLSRLGFTQKTVRHIIKKASDTALRCSFWIWLKIVI